MARRHFGTDGIRGRANSEITADMALKVGQAAGLAFRRGDHRHRVVIGKDTRLSSYMIEYALVAGFASVGVDVLLLGPVPTPAVAMLTRSMRCDLGVMISASHNPYEDNGIKLFGPDGFKLSDALETRIEALMDGDVAPMLARSADLGRARRIDDVQARYIEYAKRTLSRDVSLDGLRVVVDCANGAAYKVAPEALWELGAEVIQIGVEPNGLNINFEVGSTAPEALSAQGARDAGGYRHRARRRRRPDDPHRREGPSDRRRPGDGGDRRAVARRGPVVEARRGRHGDVEPGARAASGWPRALARAHRGRRPLRDRAHAREGLQCRGRAVGPHHSVRLFDHRRRPGGGDAGSGGGAQDPASRRARCAGGSSPRRRCLRNVRFKGGRPLDNPAVAKAIAAARERLGDRGRLLVRPSGTEPVIRVMGEADDQALVDALVGEVCQAIASAA